MVVEGEEEADPDSQSTDMGALHTVARLFESRWSRRALPPVADVAESAGISRGTLEASLHAVAEMAVQGQSKLLCFLLDYAAHLSGARALERVAITEHVLYDETPQWCSVRYHSPVQELGEKVVERACLFVVERSYTLLLRRLPEVEEQHSLPAGPSADYLILKVALSPALRVAANTTGEGVVGILKNTAPVLDSSGFAWRFRIAECDEHGGNMRAESLLRRLDQDTTSGTILCNAHKVHTSAMFTFSLGPAPALLHGLVHVALWLQGAGAYAKFKKQVLAELMERPLKIYVREKCPHQAEMHRQRCIKAFGPKAQEEPRRSVLLSVFSQEVLNGNWASSTLEHYCRGESCCSCLQDTRLKIRHFASRLLSSLRPHTFQKNNWRDWSRGLKMFGLMQGLHSIMQTAFQRTASAVQVASEPDLLADAVPFLNAAVPGSAQEESQDPTGKDAAQQRERRQHHLRESLKFLSSPDEANRWHSLLLVLVQALRPEQELMKEILFLTSNTRLLEKQKKFDPGMFNVIALHRQTYVTGMMQLGTTPMCGH